MALVALLLVLDEEAAALAIAVPVIAFLVVAIPVIAFLVAAVRVVALPVVALLEEEAAPAATEEAVVRGDRMEAPTVVLALLDDEGATLHLKDRAAPRELGKFHASVRIMIRARVTTLI